LWTPFLKANVSSCLKFCHETVNVLLWHFVDLSAETLIDSIKVFYVLVLIVHVALDKSFFAFNFINELIIIYFIEGISRVFLRPVSPHWFKVFLILLINILALLQFTSNLKEFLNELGSLDINFANTNFSTDLQKLHYVRSITLNGLDSHVIVHPLFHKSRLCKILAFFAHNHGIKPH
jgi:uncharacterized membrane protein